MPAQLEPPTSKLGEPGRGVSLREYLEILGASTSLVGVILYGAGWLIAAQTLSPLGVTPEELGISWSFLLVRVGVLSAVVAVGLAIVLALISWAPWYVQLVLVVLWLLGYAMSDGPQSLYGAVVSIAGLPIFAVLLARAITARRAASKFRKNVTDARDEAARTGDKDQAKNLDALLADFSVYEKRAAPTPWVVILATLLVTQTLAIVGFTFHLAPSEFRKSLLDGTAGDDPGVLFVVPKVAIEGLSPPGTCVLLLGKHEGTAVAFDYQRGGTVVRLPSERQMTSECEEGGPPP